ncbi:collagen alpha-1(I) chain-like isoform X1 [Canis lupus familiaris]|uniref:collagen alpha-1(I) chain-like isoform X1 n=1 Tax=Canis lupus familiaris TaxID=9615 RepID=UPI0018F5D2C4|nr:collagen alpha-1(I) chain-like isoform X1 [Canis lupus familiaris]
MPRYCGSPERSPPPPPRPGARERTARKPAQGADATLSVLSPGNSSSHLAPHLPGFKYQLFVGEEGESGEGRRRRERGAGQGRPGSSRSSRAPRAGEAGHSPRAARGAGWRPAAAPPSCGRSGRSPRGRRPASSGACRWSPHDGCTATGGCSGTSPPPPPGPEPSRGDPGSEPAPPGGCAPPAAHSALAGSGARQLLAPGFTVPNARRKLRREPRQSPSAPARRPGRPLPPSSRAAEPAAAAPSFLLAAAAARLSMRASGRARGRFPARGCSAPGFPGDLQPGRVVTCGPGAPGPPPPAGTRGGGGGARQGQGPALRGSLTPMGLGVRTGQSRGGLRGAEQLWVLVTSLPLSSPRSPSPKQLSLPGSGRPAPKRTLRAAGAGSCGARGGLQGLRLPSAPQVSAGAPAVPSGRRAPPAGRATWAHVFGNHCWHTEH